MSKMTIAYDAYNNHENGRTQRGILDFDHGYKDYSYIIVNVESIILYGHFNHN